MSPSAPAQCPLCQGRQLELYAQDTRREYWHCQGCALVFVPEAYWLSPEQERQEYDRHDNSDSPGYRRFLSRALEPALEHCPPPATALDMGCGPGPVLGAMLRESGYQCSVYDPIYAPHSEVLQQQYQLITCTEVVEHARQPMHLWQQLHDCLRPGGVLVLMTKRVKSPEAFRRWHYIQDPTHLVFYSASTLHWVAEALACSCSLEGDDVALFTRPHA